MDAGQKPKFSGGESHGIDWQYMGCGVHQAPYREMVRIMPSLKSIVDQLPERPEDFTWDVKIHMLMPKQFPCIPDWHRDFVPRTGGIQRPERANSLPMYMWLSGPPLTEFRGGFIQAGQWVKFSALDEHRGTAASDFCWRGMIRAVHSDALPPKKPGPWERRHCQVYLDSKDYNW